MWLDHLKTVDKHKNKVTLSKLQKKAATKKPKILNIVKGIQVV